MDTHVKVLGILNIVMGALGALLGLTALLVLGGIAGIIGANAPPDEAAVAVPLVGLVGSLAVGVILLLSVPYVIVGFGLLNFRSWARLLGIILSVIGLINFPLGTAIGVYGLWVLLTPETQPLFEGGGPSGTSGPPPSERA